MLLQTDGPGMILHIISLDLCHNITNSFDKIWTRCKNLTTKTIFLISSHSKQESKTIVINI